MNIVVLTYFNATIRPCLMQLGRCPIVLRTGPYLQIIRPDEFCCDFHVTREQRSASNKIS